MEKQTAVEWLVQKLNQKIDFIPMDKWDMIRDIVQQAKEMEKEQILEFTRNAVRKILDEDRQNPFNLEQYYNETFKSE
jgi:hypothetical protein